MRRVAISQSNYIPWKGYFDAIAGVDEFVLLDEVQFTRRDWRNRNRILVNGEPHWLTIPVQTRGRYTQRIDETLVSGGDWASAHLRTIEMAYARAPHREWMLEMLGSAWSVAAGMDRLSAVNRTFIERINELLGISTPLRWSSEFDSRPDPTDRLVDICTALQATTYVSGPAAKAYLDESRFEDVGIDVEYLDYSGFPEYAQLASTFRHDVSIVDTLCMLGPSTATAVVQG